jgi:type II secretory pathway component PulM
MSDLAALPRPAFRRERKIVMGVTASIFAVVHMQLITEEDHDAISHLER